jgi:vacuolar-type H+-ATPase subunit B/Vma2
MEIAWSLLRAIPREELTKIDNKIKDKYYKW